MSSEKKIIQRDVLLPDEYHRKKLAFVLYNVFTQDECQRWIDLSEQRAYSPALINTGVAQVLMKDVRNNDRCMIDDVPMAQMLFERIQSFLPETWEKHRLIGLNERLRFLRYDPGQKFEPHYGKNTGIFDRTFHQVSSRHLDGVYARSDGSGERSFLVR